MKAADIAAMLATGDYPGGLSAEDKITGTGDLARFLGGSPGSFTGDLLLLIARADPGNLSRLAAGFPLEVVTYMCWMTMNPAPTARALAAELAPRINLGG